VSHCFFFSSRRRHTRFSRDWSSDVCSSDLYLDKSIASQSTDDPLIDGFWANEIKSLYNTATAHLLNIKGFINVFKTKERLSHTFQEPKTLSKTIEIAIHYL